jgi:hypothetical protein
MASTAWRCYAPDAPTVSGGASGVAVLAHAEHDLDERAGTDLPAGATPTGC